MEDEVLAEYSELVLFTHAAMWIPFVLTLLEEV